ncbi:MAG: FHA domain-containing protein, partial [Planctomycetota bacterium]
MPTAFATPTDRPMAAEMGWDLVGPDGRSTRLGGAPVTIGSGPKCVLRIDQPTAKPVHCVVSRDGDALVARGWADGVLLNGAPIESAELSEGDRLSVAGCELTVTGLSDDEPLVEPPRTSEAAAETPTAEEPSVIAGAEDAIDGWASIEPHDEAVPDVAALLDERSPVSAASDEPFVEESIPAADDSVEAH